MLFKIAADGVVLLHLGFIAFVAAGALLVLQWPRLAWLHLPCVAWAAMIEFTGWICPLTPLENVLRQAAGESGYAGGFIQHYIVPLIYPAGLTREIQWLLGAALILINLGVYTLLWIRRRRRRP